MEKTKKKNSKKIGIKLKTNNNNDIYIYQEIYSQKKEKGYLNLFDNGIKLIEKENNTLLKFNPKETNKYIHLSYKNNNIFYQNKYTIDKQNKINQALLNEYCGFSNVESNINIQIIHNIEDIKKITSLYLNNALYTLTTIKSDNIKDIRELVSYIFPNYKYDFKKKKIITLENKNLDKLTEFINSVALIIRNRNFFYGFGNTKTENIFESLKAISLLRNRISHFQSNKCEYKLLKKEIKLYLKKYSISFVKNSNRNLYLIKKLYSNNNIETNLKKYYLYVLNEEDKNLNISIKKIMEKARDIYPSNLNEENNKKYNTILKYHLYNYLKLNKQLTEEYVFKLKAVDFDKKDAIYIELVNKIGKPEFEKVRKICENINYDNEEFVNEKILSELLENISDFNNFSLEIYSLTKFLTIKECNELISNLINKIQSIIDLLENASKLNINIEIKNNDKLLINLDKDTLVNIVKELKIINSSKKYVNPKGKQTKVNFDVMTQALMIFKNDLKKDDIRNLLDEKFENPIYKAKKIKYPIKNFIKNNVIKNKEFNYLFRYVNPTLLSNLLYKNPNLIKFLLSNLNKEELDKYKNKGVDEHSISLVTLDNLINNLKNGNMDYSNNVRLYIKCIYLLIKNMIKINSYYFIAFSFYIRDMNLLLNQNKNVGIDELRKKEGRKIYTNELNDTLNIISNTNSEDKKNMIKTLNNFKDILDNNQDFLTCYRNNIEHIQINKILLETTFPCNFEYRNYFRIYQYCLQKYLLNNLKKIDSSFLNDCKNDIEKYNRYSKKLLFSMNGMFMYNYARYKDISDEYIFNRKYDSNNKEY